MKLEQILQLMSQIISDKDIPYMIISREDVKTLFLYINQLERILTLNKNSRFGKYGDK